MKYLEGKKLVTSLWDVQTIGFMIVNARQRDLDVLKVVQNLFPQW